MAIGTLASRYAALVCDLDGVVYRGALAVPGAVASLADVAVPILYATNNASRPPEDVAHHLVELGLAVETDQVATSAQAGASALRDLLGPGARVLAVGGPGVAEALGAAGLVPVLVAGGEDSVHGVLQGYGPEVSARMLGEAAYAVQSGARWVATNTDRTLPTDRGTAPGNGTLVEAVATACGRQPDKVAGKPYPPLYLMCADRLGVHPTRILALGDRLDTDIAGAVAAGMDSLLVLTGVDDAVGAALASGATRATWVAPNLEAIHEPIERPALRADGWSCGGALYRVGDEGQWATAAPGTPAESLSAAVRAVQAALDDGVLVRDQVASLIGSVAPPVGSGG